MVQKLGIVIVFMVILGCTRGDDLLSFREGQTGITTDEIRIGSSLALGGHAGYLGTHMLHGAMAFINHVNETCGIHGRRINLIALDDGYDPARCLYNTQQLISEHGVFSLFCYVGTPTTVRIIPLVNEANIPLLGMISGANRLREPFNRLLFNTRASYYQEIKAAVDLMVKEKRFDRVAVFYQYDEYGLDGLRGAEIALKQYDLIPVAKGTYIRGTMEVEAGLEKIAASQAQAVVMIGTYDACARFIQLAGARQFAPLFYNVSFVGSKELARRLGPLGEGVMVTQVVPPPNALEDGIALPGVRDYIAMLKKYYPSSPPSFVGLEGYINARILVRGLELAGRELTREKFIQAIESIHDFDLGISNPLSFAKDDHQGLDRVYFTWIKQGRLVLIP